MQMKQSIGKYIYFLWGAFCLLTGCTEAYSPEESSPVNESRQDISLTVNAEVDLNSYPAYGEGNDVDKQHVKNVVLYIFHPSTNAVGYTCLAQENVGWSDFFGSALPETTAEMTYRIQATLSSYTTYTFLAVGYEDTPVYNICTGNGQVVSPSLSVSSLDDLKASLQDGNTKEAIAGNELFSGALTVTTDENGQIPEGSVVELRRRVAGLSACFKFNGFSEKPGKVAVMLYKDQNCSVPVLKHIWQEPDFTDYIDSPLVSSGEVNNQCLLSLDIIGDADNDYQTEEKAVYVLPIPAPAKTDATNYTLAVVIYNDEGMAIASKRAALAIDGELIFNTDLGTGIIDDESFYRYPIVANRFYNLGNADSPLNVVYNPNNPFEVIVEDTWEGIPDMGFGD